MNKDELLTAIKNVATITDLFSLATTRRAQQCYKECSDDCQHEIVETYNTTLNVVADRYKMSELHNVPILINSLEKTKNADDSYYCTLSGIRKDTDESIKVRTRSPAILNYFERHDLPQSVVFIKVENSSNTYHTQPFWTVHQLVPLTERNPWRLNGVVR